MRFDQPAKLECCSNCLGPVAGPTVDSGQTDGLHGNFSVNLYIENADVDINVDGHGNDQ